MNFIYQQESHRKQNPFGVFLVSLRSINGQNITSKAELHLGLFLRKINLWQYSDSDKFLFQINANDVRIITTTLYLRLGSSSNVSITIADTV